MKLKELIKSVENKKVFNFNNYEITDIVYDSRKVRDGNLFIAIKGTFFDGHTFIKDAIDRGAKAVIVEKKGMLTPQDVVEIIVEDSRNVLSKISSVFYGEPSKKLKLVGVTGTNGKTTTTYVLKAILNEIGIDCGLIGTISYQVGERIITSVNTTPESLELNHLLSEMVEEKFKYAIAEVSSHGLAQGRISFLQFDAGIFTNIGHHEHLDYHRNFKNYLKAKLKFFDKYLTESGKSNKVGIINIDDPYAKFFVKALKRNNIKCITYGKHSKADIRLISFEVKREGNFFEIELEGKKEKLFTGIKGKGNIYNTLAGIAYTLHEGIPFEKVKAGLEKMELVPGRFEFINEGQSFDVIVDYAHTHHALRNLLSSVKAINSGKIILVFGCGGDRDKTKRPLMGKVAVKMADVVVITSDNPRSEDSFEIIKGIEKGISIMYRKKYVVFPDRRDAIREAISLAREKDCVIIAGKGHETFQILKNTTVPFDDREEARKLIREKNSI